MDKNELARFLAGQQRKEYAASIAPEVCASFVCTRHMVPMRDGAHLETFVYLPDMEQEVYPVILDRTCYPMFDPTMQVHGEELAKRGYAFVYQYCRGIRGSEGTWEPNVHERADGLDTADWIAKQPWAGRIGMWGRSYEALVGWAMADAAAGKITSMFLGAYGTDRFVSAWEKGSFRHDVLTSWTMENAGFPIAADYEKSCRYMPHAQVDEALWGKKIDWYRDYILNEDVSDAYWQGGWWKQLREIPGKVTIPLFITSGWYDHHHGSSMVTWERLNEQAKAHSWLEVSSRNHFQNPCVEDRDISNDPKNEINNMFTWFDLTLKEGKLPDRKERYYEIGANRWIEITDSAMPADSRKPVGVDAGERVFYLQADEAGVKKLTEVKAGEDEPASDADVSDVTPVPEAEAGEAEAVSETKAGKTGTLPMSEAVSVSYVYDPANPVRTHGADAMLHSMSEAGSLLQPEPDYRPDVKSFISEPLSADLDIFGEISVKLFAATDAEDTAFTAKLMEVFPDGKTYSIRSSVTRIAADCAGDYVPGTPVQTEINMWSIFYRVKAGNRLRLDISSSDFPQYNIHSNYKGKWALQEKTKTAGQTIFCGGEYPSQICIPVTRGE